MLPLHLAWPLWGWWATAIQARQLLPSRPASKHRFRLLVPPCGLQYGGLQAGVPGPGVMAEAQRPYIPPFRGPAEPTAHVCKTCNTKESDFSPSSEISSLGVDTYWVWSYARYRWGNPSLSPLQCRKRDETKTRMTRKKRQKSKGCWKSFRCSERAKKGAIQ